MTSRLLTWDIPLVLLSAALVMVLSRLIASGGTHNLSANSSAELTPWTMLGE